MHDDSHESDSAPINVACGLWVPRARVGWNSGGATARSARRSRRHRWAELTYSVSVTCGRSFGHKCDQTLALMPQCVCNKLEVVELEAEHGTTLAGSHRDNREEISRCRIACGTSMPRNGHQGV